MYTHSYTHSQIDIDFGTGRREGDINLVNITVSTSIPVFVSKLELMWPENIYERKYSLKLVGTDTPRVFPFCNISRYFPKRACTRIVLLVEAFQ